MFGGAADSELGESTVAVYDGFAASQGVVDDHGPFRVQLASLHYQSEVHLSSDPNAGPGLNPGGSPPVPSPGNHGAASKQFFVQLLVGAEPRLSVAPAGPVKLAEATDNLGRSLIIPSRGELIQRVSGYLGVNPSPLVHLRVDLTYPDRTVGRLKRVRGSIPLQVSTRRPDPLAVPLAGA